HRSITTISRVLSEQLVDILLRNNFYPSFRINKKRKDKLGINHKESYHLYWSKEAKPQHRYLYYKPSGIKYWLLPVAEVQQRYYLGPVYNLTVEDDHSYIATNFAVANCGEGGDIFTFLMKMEGLDFGESLRALAKRANIVLKGTNPLKREKKSRIQEINEISAQFFHKYLLESPASQKALAYLKKRGLDKKTISDFRLGLSPKSKDILVNFLLKRGFLSEEIFEAGVAKRSVNRLEDLFRGRLMIPITNSQGKVVGFTARVLDDSLPKYINSPQTSIYDKSSVLFGFDKAKNSIRTEKEIVIVEGNMDVLACHQTGITNVVASSGTALTERQLDLIKRFTTNIKLAFDLDSAGETATERAIALAYKQGFDTSIIEIPKGKDPADSLKENKEAFKKAIKEAKYVIDYFFEQVFKKYDISNIVDKKRATKELLYLIKKIPDLIERSHYIKKLAQRLNIPEKALFDSLNKIEVPNKQAPQEITRRGQNIYEHLLGLILKYPDHQEFVFKNLEIKEFPKDSQSIYKSLKNWYNEENKFDIDAWLSGLNKEASRKTKFLLLQADFYFEEFGDETIFEEVYFCVGRIRELKIKKEKKKLEDKIKEAEKSGDKKKCFKLLKEFQKLAQEER
nr:DNA primase [Candidatus Aenigmarchaeota archaeon]